MVKVLRKAEAGRADKKHDVLISIEPAEPGSGIQIKIKSSVLAEFGRQIKETVESVLQETNVDDVLVQVDDKGAMNFAIRARTETAIRRAQKED